MPAKSKKQRKFMGMVHAVQKGSEIPNASPAVKKAAKTDPAEGRIVVTRLGELAARGSELPKDTDELVAALRRQRANMIPKPGHHRQFDLSGDVDPLYDYWQV
jgi:hypothetical protein